MKEDSFSHFDEGEDITLAIDMVLAHTDGKAIISFGEDGLNLLVGAGSEPYSSPIVRDVVSCVMLMFASSNPRFKAVSNLAHNALHEILDNPEEVEGLPPYLQELLHHLFDRDEGGGV